MSEQPPPPHNKDQFIHPLSGTPQGQQPLPPPMYQYPPHDPYGPRDRVYAPPKKKHNGVWIALAVVLVVGVVTCGIIGMASSGTRSVATDTTSTSAPASSASAATGKWTTTHTYSGNGAKKTEIITMPDDWKISYTCQGMNVDGVASSAVFQVYVYDQSGSIQDVAVNEICASRGTTTGTTEEHQGGQVYLDINADSAWTLKVQELKS